MHLRHSVLTAVLSVGFLLSSALPAHADPQLPDYATWNHTIYAPASQYTAVPETVEITVTSIKASRPVILRGDFLSGSGSQVPSLYAHWDTGFLLDGMSKKFDYERYAQLGSNTWESVAKECKFAREDGCTLSGVPYVVDDTIGFDQLPFHQ